MFFVLVLALAVVTAVGVSLVIEQMSPNPEKTAPATSSVAGIELQVSLNTSALSGYGLLGISITLFNTLPRTNMIATANNWTIQGFPVAVWYPREFVLPLEFDVVSGNYSLSELQAMAGNSTQGSGVAYVCMEGNTVEHVNFLPRSELANLTGTGFFGPGPNGTGMNYALGSFALSSNFTINGYWDYPLTEAEGEDLMTHYAIGSTFAYPEVGPYPAHYFVPEVYTLIVADEWGQVTVLHFRDG
jgi:hypothetical protein